MNRKTVILSFLGSSLDTPTHEDRWKKWRPNVALGQFEDLEPDRIELFTQPRFRKLQRVVEEDLSAISPMTEVRCHDLTPRDPWNFEEVFESLYQFASEYPFDVDREDYLVHITTGTHVAQICLFLLTESRHFPGRLLQLSPPKRQIKAGVNPGEYAIIDLDLSRYDQLATRFAKEASESADFLKSGIETKNRMFNDMIGQIEQVAGRSRAPILLTGPTGAGKSQLARRIYDLKRRKNQIPGPFVEVNCSTLRGDTAMSALFGHRKGAFTGAAAARSGYLKSADGGLLFLDEIGELGADEQSMLLRAIEEKRFYPVGADTEVTSDFQLISGTNQDLIDQVAAGTFRADLFARLNLWLFELPGLKDRREDIEPNITYELEKISQAMGQRVSFNKEAYEAFVKFAQDPSSPWSGNFRDLNSSITRLATLAGNRRIHRKLVDEEIARLERLWSRSGSESGEVVEILAGVLSEDELEEIDRFDRVQLAEVIAVCRESRTQSEAGRVLFSASRKRRKVTNDSDRVRKYLAKFGLDWEKVT
ncbi:MAG: RNA repair transcriptional activator RtcR [Verrucomicrobiales bacterium]|nr:RNA repair transcriptional activator RtcR [Verrucomicrobiales bacterium]